MTVSDFIQDVKLRIDDVADEALLSMEQYVSIGVRSLKRINLILGLNHQIVNDAVSPDLPETALELLNLQALVYVTETMRAKAAKTFSFKSGDKAVDKTQQPGFWSELNRDYLKQLEHRVHQLVPQLTDQSTVFHPGGFPVPEVYEVASDA